MRPLETRTRAGIHRLSRSLQLSLSYQPVQAAGPPSTNQALWLKPETLLGADGSAISQWDDSSGNTRHAVQATGAKQPVVLAAGINGKKVVRFVDDNDGLRVPAFTYDMGAFTAFVVFRKTTGNDGWVISNGVDAYTSGGMGFYSGSNDTTIVSTAGAGTMSGRTVANGNWADDGVWRIITFRYGGTHLTHKFYVNGTDSTPGNGSGSASPTGAVNVAFDVGNKNNGGAPGLPGDIAEVIFYTATLSDVDRQAVESYLGAKYDLSVG